MIPRVVIYAQLGAEVLLGYACMVVWIHVLASRIGTVGPDGDVMCLIELPV